MKVKQKTMEKGNEKVHSKKRRKKRKKYLLYYLLLLYKCPRRKFPFFPPLKLYCKNPGNFIIIYDIFFIPATVNYFLHNIHIHTVNVLEIDTLHNTLTVPWIKEEYFFSSMFFAHLFILYSKRTDFNGVSFLTEK